MRRLSLFQHLKRVKSVLITTHAHADVDAYSSVYALSNILATKGINSKIYIPDGLDEDAKRISSLLPIDRIDKFEESDAIIILDTNNPLLLGGISEKVIKSRKKIVIDHHPSLNRINGIELIDTNASSTCEVLCRLLRRVEISREVATALLLGIFTDSQHLLLANEQTIECVNRLSKFVSIAEVRRVLAKERSYAERMARLKSAKRMELYKIVDKDLIISISRVGSYHASVAKALIDLGSDLSIVISKDDSIKVSMRSSSRFYSLTNLHLGSIASKISKNGGGHSNAASFTTDRDDAYKDVFNTLTSMNYKIKSI